MAWNSSSHQTSNNIYMTIIIFMAFKRACNLRPWTENLILKNKSAKWMKKRMEKWQFYGWNPDNYKQVSMFISLDRVHKLRKEPLFKNQNTLWTMRQSSKQKDPNDRNLTSLCVPLLNFLVSSLMFFIFLYPVNSSQHFSNKRGE